ncbi:MAG: hypothetical protein IPK68_17530 [Bdellovibrionales bacterium]|nr:hypothetical protein [Bdellovibrionales bacterium]
MATADQIRYGTRPNWDPYPFWNGFYNGLDDGRATETNRPDLYHHTSRSYAEQFQSWQLFLAQNRMHGLYQYLPNLEKRFFNPNETTGERPLLEFTQNFLNKITRESLNGLRVAPIGETLKVS